MVTNDEGKQQSGLPAEPDRTEGDRHDAARPGDTEMSLPAFDVERLGARDTLRRGPFARYLLKVVQAVNAEAGGAVIAIEGPWGSGKSWVLERARQASEESPSELLWVSFSPWQLSGSDALIEALIAQIGEQVNARLDNPNGVRRGAELGEALIDFAEALGTLRHVAPAASLLSPVMGLAVGAVGYASSTAAAAAKGLQPALRRLSGKPPVAPVGSIRTATHRLSASRDRVRKALEALGRRLVIVIDDVDRMTPAEIGDIVQMVRAVADFPNAVYVLAYDPSVVARGLRIALRVNDGRAFLEKIVQVALPMPPAQASLLEQELDRAVTRALDYAHWAPPEAQRDDLEDALPLAAALLDSPRDVKRLEVHLKLAARALKQAICPADLLLITALQLKAPSVIDRIEAERDVLMLPGHLAFLRAHQARGDIDNDPGGAVSKARLTTATQLGNSPPQSAATHFLFSRLSRRHAAERARLDPYRLQRLPNWLRWRAYVVQDDWAENEALHDLVREPNRVKDSRWWTSPERFTEFLVFATPFVESHAGFDAAGLIGLQAEAARHFGSAAEIERLAVGITQPISIAALVRHCTPEQCERLAPSLLDAKLLWPSWWVVLRAAALDPHRPLDLAAEPTSPLVQRMHESQALNGLVARWQGLALNSLRDPAACTAWGTDPWALAKVLVEGTGAAPALVREAFSELLQGSADDGFAAMFAGPGKAALASAWLNGAPWFPSQAFVQQALSLAPRFREAYPDESKFVEEWDPEYGASPGPEAAKPEA